MDTPHRSHNLGAHQQKILEGLYSGECWSLERIKQDLPSRISAKTLRKSVRGLLTHSLLEYTPECCYRITDNGKKAHEAYIASDVEVEPITDENVHKNQSKMKDHNRQRAWNMLRMGKAVTAAEMAGVVARNSSDQTANLRKYLRSLEEFGYVKKLPNKKPPEVKGARGQTLYLLVKNTGMIAPVYLSTKKKMMDLNKEEIYSCPQV